MSHVTKCILALVAAAVVVTPSVQGNTYDACESYELTNVEILSQLIDERVNASVNASIESDAKVTETITEHTSEVAFDRRINESISVPVSKTIPEIINQVRWNYCLDNFE